MKERRSYFSLSISLFFYFIVSTKTTDHSAWSMNVLITKPDRITFYG